MADENHDDRNSEIPWICRKIPCSVNKNSVLHEQINYL